MVMLLSLVLLALAAGRPLALPDEGRYGDIGRYMMVSGDWLAPRLDGIPFFHKPPLLHWLQAAALSAAGVHPWVSRWVPVLHAVLMLGFMAWTTQRLLGPQVALRATLMLGTSLAFLIGGQYINHDMLVAAWISVAIWSFALSLLQPEKPCRRLAWLGFAACALGVLAKGLIGVVLPGLVLVIWVTLARLWRKTWSLPWFSGVALFAVITLPWFALAQHQYPGLFDYLIIGQHFGRFTGTAFNNPWPWWFYAVILCGLLFPWAFWAYASGIKSLFNQPRRMWQPVSATSSLLWTWLLAITVFFSIPTSKLVGYILPVLPPLAVIAADVWQRRWASHRLSHVLFAMLCALNLGLATWVNHEAGRFSQRHSSADVAHQLICHMQASDTVWVAGGYPYDLPYLAHLQQPVVVLSDWEQARKTAGDNWQREMFEGADFDPAAAQRWLQPMSQLQAPHTPKDWLVAPVDFDAALLTQWAPMYQGQTWALWQGKGSAGESPVSTQDKGLNCGQSHGQPK
jgi:4-amino-4-deoxy-L-arabinose transferase-like glycosyltransferase